MRLLTRLILSPWLQAGRGVGVIVSCLIILGVINMAEIDISVIQTPEAFLPFMLAAAVIMAFLGAFIYQERAFQNAGENKLKNGKIESLAKFKKDNRYVIGTVIAIIFGAGAGMYLTAYVIDYAGIIGAGQWTFVVIAGLIACGVSVILTGVNHLGVRLFLVKAKNWVSDCVGAVTECVPEIVDDIKKVQSMGQGVREEPEEPIENLDGFQK